VQSLRKIRAILTISFQTLGLLFASSAACCYAGNVAAGAEHQDLYQLQQSKPLVARAGAWQTWNDRLHIKPGLDKRKIVLTFINGADGRNRMTGIKVLLSGKPIATIDDFNADGTFSRDLNGTVSAGKIPITVQGFGPSGARLVWKLSTDEIIITAVRPNPFGSAQKISVQGRNFSDNPADVKVTIADNPAKILSARRTELEVQLPPHLQGGRRDLVVAIGPVKSNVYAVGTSVAPEIAFLDMFSTAPGHPVVIHGKGFSPNPDDNVVTFGSLKAHVSDSSETTITCEVPDMDFPRWHVPINVTTFGIRTKKPAEIHIDMRVIPTEEHPNFIWRSR
jgi:IPT/TIG domain